MTLSVKQTPEGWTISSKKKIVVYLSGNVPGVRSTPVIGLISKHKLITEESERFILQKPIKFFASESEANEWLKKYNEIYQSL